MPTTPPINVPITGDDKLSKKLDKIEAKTKRVAAKIKKVGTVMTRYLAVPILGVGAAAVKASLNINEGMANVATLIPGNIERVKKLKGSVQDLAKATGKSTSDITDGLYETISAFGDSAETVGRLDVALKAGVAGRAETLESLKLLSAVTKGYGDTSVAAMQKVSDLSFLTVALGQTTFPELAASMGKVVPLAAALNTSQEELFGTFATLTGVTKDAADVSTQLASIYGAALKPTKEMTAAAKKLGFESAIAMFKEKGLAGSLKALNEHVDGSREALSKMLTRKEAIVAAMALLGGQADTYAQKLEKIKKYSGATTKAYKEQTEGINKAGHGFKKLIQRVVVMGQKLGDKLVPVLSKLLDRFEPWLKKLEQLDEHHITQAIQIGKWILKLTIATKVIGGLTSVFGPFIMKMLAAKKATAALGAATAGAPGLFGKMASKTGTLTSKIGKLAGAFGALGVAALVGHEIGKMINDIWLNPQMDRALGQRKKAYDTELKASMMLGRQVPKDQQKIQQALEEKKKILDEISKKQVEVSGSFGAEDVVGTLMAPFTGEDTPGEKREKQVGRLSELWDKHFKEMQKLNRASRNLQAFGDIEATSLMEQAGPVEKYLGTEKTVVEKRTEEKVTIDWGKPPPGVNIIRDVEPPTTGVLMQGI